MKKTFLIFAAILLICSTAYASKPELPNPKKTPGDVLKDVTLEQLCTSGYTKTVRHVTTQTKMEVLRNYGLQDSEIHKVEIDHLISLELGGSNDASNLWPEHYLPTPGARQKDVLENYLHRCVCNHTMTLKDAQHKIASNWYAAYLDMKAEMKREGIRK